MSLTEDYADDSSDDGVELSGNKVEDLRGGVKKDSEETPAAANLNASNLERHDKNTRDGAGTLPEFNNRHGHDECDDSETKTQVGAGLFFGLSGLLIGGPILGVLTGTGAAIVASKDKGPAGDVARATGDFAMATGSKVGEAAKEVNEKHGILDKIKNAFVAIWGRFQQFDEEHKISEKTKDTMSDVTQMTVEFEGKHHVMENILRGIQNGADFLLVKLKDATGGESGTGNERS